MKFATPRAQAFVLELIAKDYGGSQGLFSSRCGVDTAYTCRLVAGSRPVTIGFVRQMMETLEEAKARTLRDAFLSDVAQALGGDGKDSASWSPDRALGP